ncbi:50S ribosomal protein L10 [Nicoliella spurrieriana]|uniref:Large ribosomal subunit protein uL10 n=1 Tax=Nicoliella spurrieriana TaxID=2925830 RepID=A0A976RSD6_9LACO|nr:50S ribosomal protein L10 [Nicoliella spurrieriana]UQS87012.1 50S ribosomal protein L10 [Nicoliella spurrieriana]
MRKDVLAAKEEQVEKFTKLFQNANTAVVVNYRGLDVADVTDLRKQLRDAGVSLHVIKNNVVRRAAEKAGYEELNDVFVGPTAVAFSDEDPIAPAKILKKFADNNDALVLKGGMIEDKVASLDEIEEFASLPSRDELLATLANVLQAPVRNVAYAVKAVADKDDDSAA